jgi:hypothetical protein
MNDGVALLLERMKTNPEEFYSNVTGKWAHIINTYKPYLNDEDTKALEEELATLMQQRFTEEIMEELVEPKKSDSWVEQIMQQKGIATATTTPVPSTITLSRKEQINAMKVEVRKKATLKKEHKTLFGKLFNYS